MNFTSFIEANKEEMIEVLRDLIRFDTKKSQAFKSKEGEIYPFGKGVQDAFIYTLNKAKEWGFDVENIDNYGGHIDMGGYVLDEEGDIERVCPYMLGVLGHLDVVPEGEGWSKDPFGAELIDGRIYGRGTQDDKGPTVAALFAMKALKDAGFNPTKKVRLILGLDEETGWSGMDYYFKYAKKPDFGFTPDADFPVINGEKGILTFELAKKIEKTKDKGLELRSIKAGTAPNMVPANARCVVRAEDKDIYAKIKDKAAEFRLAGKGRINIKGVGKSLEIQAIGKASHAARPEEGINAISVLMDFLKGINFVNEDVNDIIDWYARYIGNETDGKSLGCAMQDEPSGALTLNVGQMEMNDESVSFVINVRYPVTKTDDEVYEKIKPVIERYDFGLIKDRHQKPIYMPEDHPLIQTLMKVYQDHTGDTESKPIVIGGGSYARAVENAVAFGGMFPGDEDRMHQKDEYISIENLVKMCEIYADAIYMLSKDEEMSF